MIEASGLSHRYGNQTVLSLANLTVKRDETCLILGGSGSGKTTLLHILGGILAPSEGEVKVDKVSLKSLVGSALDRFRGQRIGMVLQRFHLIDAISVLQNLILAQTLAGNPADPAAAEKVLADLGLTRHAHARPRDLSHGQAQRVAIARAVINQPAVILADEPTSNLDDKNCMEALQLIRRQAHACNAALIIATHDSRIKNEIANRVELGNP